LDNSLAEPHATLIIVNHFAWKVADAEAAAKRSIELNPNYATAHHWYSRVLRSVNRNDEAWTEIKRAYEIDPLSMVIINNIAEQYVDRGDTKAAMEESKRLIDLDPNFWAGYTTFGNALVKQGRYDEALAAGQKAEQLSNRSSATLAFVGHVYGRLGKRSEAEAVIKELEERYAKKEADGRDLAVVYAGLDDRNQAFAWLEKAFADKSNFLAILRLEPSLDPLKSDPRWNELLRRVGV
jgi:tetratricopeptide (TPR) repeat protein